MSNLVKTLLTDYSDVITPFIQDIIYNTIPDGEVLRRVHNAPKKACRVSYDGCNSCIRDEEDDWYVHCTLLSCPYTENVNVCHEYFCPEEELPAVLHDRHMSNKICGTNLNVTVAGCFCNPEYQYRDKNSLKCLKTCP